MWSRLPSALVPAAFVVGGFMVYACASSGARDGFAASDGGAGASSGAPAFADDAGPGCTGLGLDCRRPACDGGGTTSIEGDVYDPALKNKLYDVLV